MTWSHPIILIISSAPKKNPNNLYIPIARSLELKKSWHNALRLRLEVFAMA